MKNNTMFHKILPIIIIVLALTISISHLFGEEHSILANIAQDSYSQEIIRCSYRPGAINEQGVSHEIIKSQKGFAVWPQQICWGAIVTGIGKEQEQDIRLGLKAIQYSFEKMKDDGSFENSSVAGASRFLLAFAKSYYEIENSKYKQRYIGELNSYIPKIKKATYYVLNSPQWKREVSRISDYSNQEIGMGLTFKLLGTILRDPKIIEYGNELFYQSLNKQTKEGIFPEKGGYDSSYQAVSLQFIELYYLYLANNKERKSLFRRLKKGWEWELTRIKGSGEIKVEGNTRTGLKQEIWHGKFKGVNYPEVALSLIYWCHINNDKNLRKLARKVFEYGIKYRKK